MTGFDGQGERGLTDPAPDGGPAGSTAPRWRRPTWWAALAVVLAAAVAVIALDAQSTGTGQPARTASGTTSGTARPGGTGTTTTLTTGAGHPATTDPSAPAGSVPPPPISAPPTVPPTTAPLAPGDVGIQVTGSGQASVTVIDGANVSSQDVTLPWGTTLTDNPNSVDLTAQSSDGSASATLACELDVPGAAPVTDASSGPFTVVSCATVPGT